jgi:hypothetical protein
VKTTDLLLIGALGLGAYYIFSRKTTQQPSTSTAPSGVSAGGGGILGSGGILDTLLGTTTTGAAAMYTSAQNQQPQMPQPSFLDMLLGTTTTGAAAMYTQIAQQQKAQEEMSKRWIVQNTTQPPQVLYPQAPQKSFSDNNGGLYMDIEDYMQLSNAQAQAQNTMTTKNSYVSGGNMGRVIDWGGKQVSVNDNEKVQYEGNTLRIIRPDGTIKAEYYKSTDVSVQQAEASAAAYKQQIQQQQAEFYTRMRERARALQKKK